mmetsp:Transcript_18979/g.47919  ORF Transcript_18979/g.47919 Transcript_18979/m.47919 type:complete len:251 (+) Transcript_18979:75-827(+)
MDTPKRVLVLLDGLDTRRVPANVLGTTGIRRDGIVALDLPRFPRVSDVKSALWYRLQIPTSEQVLRGPLPDTSELLRDWVHLSKLGVLPGLGGERTRQRSNRRPSGSAHPGELFSSAKPVNARLDKDGATVSDILRVTTKHPVVEYLPGGSIYMQRLKRKWRLRTVMKLALFFFVLSAVLYVLWLVPGYEMPSYTKPVTGLDQDASGSLEAAGNSSIISVGMSKQPSTVSRRGHDDSVHGSQQKPRQDEL